jgi:hypothetical protein
MTLNESQNGKTLNKTIRVPTEQNGVRRVGANFKTGALNHSATLPSIDFFRLFYQNKIGLTPSC